VHKAGVPVLAGTDANSEKLSPFNVQHGESLHHELELLVEAGLSNLDALRAATSLPAQYFDLKDRGVIEPGRRADLILIAGNPLEDIKATRLLKRIWCAGIERLNLSSLKVVLDSYPDNMPHIVPTTMNE
jgi:imidazolonepropionase-like amidohydrolase